jgi:hypothetical protein
MCIPTQSILFLSTNKSKKSWSCKRLWYRILRKEFCRAIKIQVFYKELSAINANIDRQYIKSLSLPLPLSKCKAKTYELAMPRLKVLEPDVPET